jgi:hypothetical protein
MKMLLVRETGADRLQPSLISVIDRFPHHFSGKTKASLPRRQSAAWTDQYHDMEAKS